MKFTRSAFACFTLAVAPAACTHAGAGSRVPPIGSIATLGPGASHGEEIGQPCLPTRSELDATFGLTPDGATAMRHVTDDAVPLAPRLRVRLLAREAAGRDVRLRLLDGPWAGVACWVDARADGLF